VGISSGKRRYGRLGRDRWFRPVGNCGQFDGLRSREVAGDDVWGMVIDAEQVTMVDLGWLLGGVLGWSC